MHLWYKNGLFPAHAGLYFVTMKIHEGTGTVTGVSAVHDLIELIV